MNVHAQLKLSMLLLSLSTASCSSMQSKQPLEMEQEPSYLRLHMENEIPSGSIYQASSSKGLFEDIKANQVGDILTISLNGLLEINSFNF